MRRTTRQRVLTWSVVVIAVATVVGLAVIYPTQGVPEPAQQGFAATNELRFPGQIVAVREVDGTDDFLMPGAREVQVDVRLDTGGLLTIDTIDETGLYEPGRAVHVAQISTPGVDPLFAIVDFRRGIPLTALAAAFALAVVALGRWQGVRALVGLGVSGLLIIVVAIPALLVGGSPTVVALVVAMAVMLVTLPLSHGWSTTTRAAIAGTAVALVATVVLALVTVRVTSLTGLASEDVQLLRFAIGSEIDIRGLLLAGIIIGTLGVLDDVTVSQASTVAALRRANPGMSDREVFGEALRVGRDHIAATVNTLFLAYAGAALPLLILFSVGDGPIIETLTSELVAQEIVRTMVGSVGLILAVPLTTLVAAATIDPDDPVAHDHGLIPQSAVEATTAPVAARAAGRRSANRPDNGEGGEGRALGNPAKRDEPDEPDHSLKDRGKSLEDQDSKTTNGQTEDEWTDSLRRAYGLDSPPSD